MGGASDKKKEKPFAFCKIFFYFSFTASKLAWEVIRDCLAKARRSLMGGASDKKQVLLCSINKKNNRLQASLGD
jgi:hypothetical protein